MKKVLFATSALVAASFASAASAQDVELSLGGYLTTGVGVGQFAEDQVNVRNDFHIIFDSEIHFNARGTLDNGLEIRARIELEGVSVTDQIDEQWVSVTSNFGTFEIGGNDTAADRIAGGSGVTSIGLDGVYDPSFDFIPASIDPQNNPSGDSLGVHYFTPTIFGLRLGVSYQQTDVDAISNTDTDADPVNNSGVVSFGARYNNTFGEVDFELGAGLVFTNDEDIDYGFQIGAEIGFSGFNFGARYEFSESLAGTDRDIITAGVEYSTGPWDFGVAFGYEDNQGGDEEYVVGAGFAYELGNGVNVGAHVMYGHNENNVGTETDGVGGALLLGIDF